MCGIALVIGKDFDKIPDTMNRRGPDDSGVWIKDNVILLQTRLKITGESNIPLPYETERHVMLFNGEIYNYKDFGLDFKYDGDFEAPLLGYEKYGSSFYKMIDGQYAVIIYDKENNEIKCFTDSLKIRRIYNYSSNGVYVLSSDIKTIRDIVGKIDYFNDIPDMGYGSIARIRCGNYS